MSRPADKEGHSKITAEGLRGWWPVLAFSVVYFVDASIRAHDKFFWYDEVFTKYFCRLGSVQALWHALKSGVDFNPPFFYWLTRTGEVLFGEGRVGLRITEIVGFWVFCVCLFRFVARRTGVIAGSLAMVLPVVTQAYFWAYDARPHALVLCFCGFALVFWQRAAETVPCKRGWLAMFSVALLGAMLMHCFAVVLIGPFALVEIYRSWRARRVDWAVWFAFFVPPALATALYIPLLLSYRRLLQGTSMFPYWASGWTRFELFYRFLFYPCMLVLLAGFALFALNIYRGPAPACDPETRSLNPLFRQDLLLGICFTLLPLFGIALGKLIHGPFFNRYYLASTAGICILASMGAGIRTNAKWVVRAFLLVVLLSATVNSGRLLVAKITGQGELLLLPDSYLEMDTTPGRPLLLHPLLESPTGTNAIAIVDPIDFMYLMENAPEALKRRLYFVSATTSDFAYGGFVRFLEVTPVKFNPPLTIEHFVQKFPKGAMYGKTVGVDLLAMGTRFGCHINDLRVDGGYFLAECESDQGKRGT